MKLRILQLLLIAIGANAQAPFANYSLPKEIIAKKTPLYDAVKFSDLSPIGVTDKEIVYSSRDEAGNIAFFLFDESTKAIRQEPVQLDQERNKVVRATRQNDIFLFTGYFRIAKQFQDKAIDELASANFNYQHLWIQTKIADIRLDSLPHHFVDKFYECRFSHNSRYVICNPFTFMTTSYDDVEDGVILVYDLQDATKGKLDKASVKCNNCIRSQIIRDSLIFQKEIPVGKGFDGDYHNIYKAPLSNIEDTTLIACDVEIVMTAPDGRYILGQRKLYGRYCPVIIDVKQSKIQYIVGRKYLVDRSFYSTQKKMFGFDFGEHVVYIEMPKSFPFNAWQRNVGRTSQAENDLFWSKFSLPTLK